MRYSTLLGLVGIVMVGVGLTKKEQDPIERVETNTADTSEIFPEIEEPTDGLGRDCLVMAPWGQMAIVRFSPSQWRMVQQLAVMCNVDVQDVVCDVAVDRYKAGGEGLLPPPPGLAQFMKDFFGNPDDLDGLF